MGQVEVGIIIAQTSDAAEEVFKPKAPRSTAVDSDEDEEPLERRSAMGSAKRDNGQTLTVHTPSLGAPLPKGMTEEALDGMLELGTCSVCSKARRNYDSAACAVYSISRSCDANPESSATHVAAREL